jgi:hypothetical protein
VTAPGEFPISPERTARGSFFGAPVAIEAVHLKMQVITKLARISHENSDRSCGARTLRAASALLPTYGHGIVPASEVGVERVSTRHAWARAPHRLADCEKCGLQELPKP